MSAPKVVHVGAHSAYGDLVRMRTKRREDEIDDEQDDRIGGRDSNRCRAGHGTQRHLGPPRGAVAGGGECHSPTVRVWRPSCLVLNEAFTPVSQIFTELDGRVTPP